MSTALEKTTKQQAVCVIDDDPLVCRTISGILEQAGYVPTTCASGSDFFRLLDHAHVFDCVLLDVNMPEADGLQVLKKMAEQGITVPVVMISGHGDIGTAVAAMQDGAVDFVEKPFTPEHLEKVVARAVAIGATAGNRVPGLENLSSREMEVLELLVAGDANKVIAYKLGISQRTVEVHRARIMERLAVKSFADLVRRAIAAGL